MFSEVKACCWAWQEPVLSSRFSGFQSAWESLHQSVLSSVDYNFFCKHVVQEYNEILDSSLCQLTADIKFLAIIFYAIHTLAVLHLLKEVYFLPFFVSFLSFYALKSIRASLLLSLAADSEPHLCFNTGGKPQNKSQY